MTVFDILIWVGVALTLGGLAALMWCILTVIRARRQGLDDQAFRERLRKVTVVNMAALAISALGLMAVAFGAIMAG